MVEARYLEKMSRSVEGSAEYRFRLQRNSRERLQEMELDYSISFPVALVDD